MKKKKSKREKLLIKQEFRCFYCKDKFGPYIHSTFDHNIPVSRGGNSTIHNLVLACEPCNYQKNNLTVEEFLSEDKGGAKRMSVTGRWFMLKKDRDESVHKSVDTTLPTCIM